MNIKFPTTFLVIFIVLLISGITIHVCSPEISTIQVEAQTEIVRTSIKTKKLSSPNKASNNAKAIEPIIENAESNVQSKNSPSAKEKTEAEINYKGLFDRLEGLKKCSQGIIDCNLPQTDSRSAELELGRRIANTIDIMTILSQSSENDNEQYHEIAQEYVKHHDGHVQESALELMATLEPNPDSVKALIQGLNSTHDAKIYNMSLMEFSRHTDPHIKLEIDTLLVNTLKTGGHFASQEVAKNILPLLNSENIEKYRQVLEQIPRNSAKAKSLKANIEEFEMQQIGG